VEITKTWCVVCASRCADVRYLLTAGVLLRAAVRVLESAVAFLLLLTAVCTHNMGCAACGLTVLKAVLL
jgi:hypothetical protein